MSTRRSGEDEGTGQSGWVPETLDTDRSPTYCVGKWQRSGLKGVGPSLSACVPERAAAVLTSVRPADPRDWSLPAGTLPRQGTGCPPGVCK